MSFDTWRASGPHDDQPDAEERTESCETCGAPVSAAEVSWCFGCHHWSSRTKRPEHEGESEERR